MKKSILLIFIALITAMGCQAQESAKRDSTAISKYQARHTLQGLKAFFETGYLWGLGGEAYIESPTGEMMPLDKIYSHPAISAHRHRSVANSTTLCLSAWAQQQMSTAHGARHI